MAVIEDGEARCVAGEQDLAAVETRAAAGAAQLARLLAELPDQQRRAVLARVVDERGYDEIAVGAGVSEAVARKRVSRGLAGLRRRWEERT